MKKIITLMLLIYAAIMLITFYFVYYNIRAAEFYDVRVNGLVVSIPGYIKNFTRVRSQFFTNDNKRNKLHIIFTDKEGFNEMDHFKNYSYEREMNNGKFFFYLRSKYMYTGNYFDMGEKVLIIKYYVNSNSRPYFDNYVRTLLSLDIGHDKDEINKISDEINSKFTFFDERFILIVFLAGGLSILIIALVFKKIGSRPKELEEKYGNEGIIFEKENVPVTVRSALNLNLSCCYILVTGKFFRIFSSGREQIQIPIKDLKSYYKNSSKIEIPMQNFKYIIKVKDLGYEYLL